MSQNELTTNEFYRLGNMTLLLSKDNIEASDKTFNDKKTIFSNSSLIYTKDLSKKQKWNKTILDKRQKFFASESLSIWKLK